MPYPKPDGEREWLPSDGFPLPLATHDLASRWTRVCWWLSRKLGGRSVFGKQDFS